MLRCRAAFEAQLVGARREALQRHQLLQRPLVRSPQVPQCTHARRHSTDTGHGASSSFLPPRLSPSVPRAAGLSVVCASAAARESSLALAELRLQARQTRFNALTEHSSESTRHTATQRLAAARRAHRLATSVSARQAARHKANPIAASERTWNQVSVEGLAHELRTKYVTKPPRLGSSADYSLALHEHAARWREYAALVGWDVTSLHQFRRRYLEQRRVELDWFVSDNLPSARADELLAREVRSAGEFNPSSTMGRLLGRDRWRSAWSYRFDNAPLERMPASHIKRAMAEVLVRDAMVLRSAPLLLDVVSQQSMYLAFHDRLRDALRAQYDKEHWANIKAQHKQEADQKEQARRLRRQQRAAAQLTADSPATPTPSSADQPSSATDADTTTTTPTTTSADAAAVSKNVARTLENVRASNANFFARLSSMQQSVTKVTPMSDTSNAHQMTVVALIQHFPRELVGRVQERVARDFCIEWDVPPPLVRRILEMVDTRVHHAYHTVAADIANDRPTRNFDARLRAGTTSGGRRQSLQFDPLLYITEPPKPLPSEPHPLHSRVHERMIEAHPCYAATGGMVRSMGEVRLDRAARVKARGFLMNLFLSVHRAAKTRQVGQQMLLHGYEAPDVRTNAVHPAPATPERAAEFSEAAVHQRATRRERKLAYLDFVERQKKAAAAAASAPPPQPEDDDSTAKNEATNDRQADESSPRDATNTPIAAESGARSFSTLPPVAAAATSPPPATDTPSPARPTASKKSVTAKEDDEEDDHDEDDEVITWDDAEDAANTDQRAEAEEPTEEDQSELPELEETTADDTAEVPSLWSAPSPPVVAPARVPMMSLALLQAEALNSRRERTQRRHATYFERQIRSFLDDHGIRYVDEEFMKDRPFKASPDIVLLDDVWLRVHYPQLGGAAATKLVQVRWIEVKAMYGACIQYAHPTSPRAWPSPVVRGWLEQANRYVERFGPGAVVFESQFCLEWIKPRADKSTEGNLPPGVTFLDFRRDRHYEEEPREELDDQLVEVEDSTRDDAEAGST